MTFNLKRAAMVVAVLVLAACQDAPPVTSDPGDTPQAAVSRAETALSQGDFTRARTQFDTALSLDPRFIPAYEGLARLGLEADQWEMGLSMVEKGRTWLETPEQHWKFSALQMRLLTDRAQGDWVDEVYDVMSKERRRDEAARENAELNLRLGEAYLKAFKATEEITDLDKAETFLDRAARKGGEYGSIASLKLSEASKIRETSLGSATASRLALRASLNRSDIVALLESELDLPRLIPGFGNMALRKGEVAEDGDADYLASPNAETIRQLHRLKLRSLKIRAGSFHPRQEVTREGFAILIEDLMMKITGNRKLATAQLGQKSPFADVPGTRPSFNAIMNAVGRGYLSADAAGNFAPTSSISGADAIKALRRLATLKPAS